MSNKFRIEIEAENNASPKIRELEQDIGETDKRLEENNRHLQQNQNLLQNSGNRLTRFGKALQTIGVNNPIPKLNRSLIQLNRLFMPDPQPLPAGGDSGGSGSGARAGAEAGESGAAAGAVGALGRLSVGAGLVSGSLYALDFAAKKLTDGYGKTTTDILYNAQMVNMGTEQYQKLVKIGELLHISPESMTSGLMNFNDKVTMAAKGIDSQTAYMLNVLKVPISRIGGAPTDLTKPIDTAQMTGALFKSLSRSDISDITKMQALQQFGMPREMLRYLQLNGADKKHLSGLTQQSTLTQKELETGRKQDLSDTLREQNVEGAKNKLIKDMASPIRSWLNATTSGLLQNIMGQAPGAKELYQPLQNRRAYPSEIPSLIRPIPEPRQPLVPPLLQRPQSQTNPAVQQNNNVVDVHIYGAQPGARASVSVNGQQQQARIHHTMSGLPE
jgi:hypothetical protein